MAELTEIAETKLNSVIAACLPELQVNRRPARH